jgi:beta-D-galactosyl-(1->4)-L-rhamnose phosphorylase
MARVLGVDRDTGDRVANGKFKYAVAKNPHFITSDASGALDLGKGTDGIFALGADTQVLAERESSPLLATHSFGKGRSVYLGGFKFTHENTRLLHRALFWAASREGEWGAWQSTNVHAEATWFAKSGKLVVINNAGEPQETTVTLADGKRKRSVKLDAHGIAILNVK